MKVQDWWVKRYLLTSGIDPTPEMSLAAKQFPDEFTPVLYMTGDAHRKPAPFQWASRGFWADFFKQFIEMNKLCCHVEEFSDGVKATSVPKLFEPVFHNHKVYGFEPNVFKTIREILLFIQEVRPNIESGQSLAKREIHYVTKLMWLVHDMGYMKAEGEEAMRQWGQIQKINVDPVPAKGLPLFSAFLRSYNLTAMALRTGVNDEMGAKIQRVIKQYPDHVHMITCGDAHIVDNPLYQYIQPPIGCFGIADEHNCL
jgi:hypothetical protein